MDHMVLHLTMELEPLILLEELLMEVEVHLEHQVLIMELEILDTVQAILDQLLDSPMELEIHHMELDWQLVVDHQAV